jgi:membrane protein CcdC involved in cytochrome C biogenesis
MSKLELGAMFKLRAYGMLLIHRVVTYGDQ